MRWPSPGRQLGQPRQRDKREHRADAIARVVLARVGRAAKHVQQRIQLPGPDRQGARWRGAQTGAAFRRQINGTQPLAGIGPERPQP